jgi:hypothetical protein
MKAITTETRGKKGWDTKIVKQQLKIQKGYKGIFIAKTDRQCLITVWLLLYNKRGKAKQESATL